MCALIQDRYTLENISLVYFACGIQAQRGSRRGIEVTLRGWGVRCLTFTSCCSVPLGGGLLWDPPSTLIVIGGALDWGELGGRYDLRNGPCILPLPACVNAVALLAVGLQGMRVASADV